MILIFSLNLILSFMFLIMNHPMTMGFILLIQTITVAIIIGILNLNFWFSYILFMIMVGGLLVLFIYMTSIASNELLKFSSNTFITLLMLIPFMIMVILTTDNYLIFKKMNFMENIFYKNLFLIKFFNYPSFTIILMMMIYLLITLIAIVKITKIEYGPLRQKY
uniref:NADH-ubiquinone oxidoreductase chain 6 n=1 Tax=Staphylinidae sp. BMNH 1274658 TaxID=1796587 RepID=A0A126TFY1_9COLE|nr:NADH dehydrogenase subunit 6 [Staphylinidae sp. BMNH 1274658]